MVSGSATPWRHTLMTSITGFIKGYLDNADTLHSRPLLRC
jgi:hypothetical protein